MPLWFLFSGSAVSGGCIGVGIGGLTLPALYSCFDSVVFLSMGIFALALCLYTIWVEV